MAGRCELRSKPEALAERASGPEDRAGADSAWCPGGRTAPLSAWVPASPTSVRMAARPPEPRREPHESLHSSKACGASEGVSSIGGSQEAGPREDPGNDMFMPHSFSKFMRGRLVFDT